MRRRFLFNKDIEESLVITANEPSTVTFDVYALGTCEYNLNNTGWVKYTTTTYSLNTGETISFRGDLSTSSTAIDQGVGRFSIDGNVDLYGSPMYLLAGQFLKEGVFESLFAYCGIRNVSSTFLPATTLADSCYYSMFQGCTSLTTAPELPATTLEERCYYFMFRDCKSLTTAPELPATTLANHCYQHMFQNCTSLTVVPELPATTLSTGCYSNMFYGCTSLTTAPELPATTLSKYCYSNMFRGCSKLNYIKMLATDISASDCLFEWVYGVSSTGTFVKHPDMNSLPTGSSGIPSGWTVVNDGEESGGNLTFPVRLYEGSNNSNASEVISFFNDLKNSSERLQQTTFWDFSDILTLPEYYGVTDFANMVTDYKNVIHINDIYYTDRMYVYEGQPYIHYSRSPAEARSRCARLQLW